MKVALCAFSFSQRPSCYLTTIGMEEIFSPSLLLSLSAPLATVNSPSLHEMLLLCLRGCGIAQGSSTGLQHCHYDFTAPFFTRAEINEESERYACYKNERHGKRFPSRSHSKAERQSETVLQVSSENKVAYGSWRQFLEALPTSDDVIHKCLDLGWNRVSAMVLYDVILDYLVLFKRNISTKKLTFVKC